MIFVVSESLGQESLFLSSVYRQRITHHFYLVERFLVGALSAGPAFQACTPSSLVWADVELLVRHLAGRHRPLFLHHRGWQP